MKRPESFLARTRFGVRAFVVLTAVLLFAIITNTAFTQKAVPADAPEATVGVEEFKDNGHIKEEPGAIDQKSISPNAITASTYPFTSSAGALLEDMSSGTTTMIAPNTDDGASPLFDIGFEFWFDGTRFTQFSTNANGLMRLGPTVVSTAFTNDLASATNVPQIAPYWDDLWLGTNGKVHYKVVGAAPTRKLVVEWQNEQVPRLGVGLLTGAATYQAWLYETMGVIEFVYGSGLVTNTANSGYSVGFGSSATQFASVTTSGPTAAYGTANNVNTNAITSGTKYTFSPMTPVAASGFNVTAITQTGMTLNWTDNSSNELGFAIYRSDDGGSTYNFIQQAAANTSSLVVTNLLPGVNYFWRVLAVTEGNVSAATSGNATTTAPGSKTASSGNWNVAGTWTPSGVPSATDNVTIPDGVTVTLNAAGLACNNLIVGGGASGTLQYDATTASALTVSGSVTVNSGASFNAGSGVLTTHTLTVGGTSTTVSSGSITNNGTFDMNTTASANVTFAGNINGVLSGSGGTFDFFSITVNKGANSSAILDATSVITTSTVSTSTNRLVITTGTFRLSSASNITPIGGTQTVCAAAGRLWLNNAGAVYNGGFAGSPTVTGELRIDSGTFNYGSGNNTLTFTSGSGILTMTGGTLNMLGAVAFGSNVSTQFIMSGGNINVDPNATNALAVATAVFTIGGSTTVNWTGGNITIIDPHSAVAGTAFSAAAGSSKLITGGTVNIGDGTSTTASGALSNTTGFGLTCSMGVWNLNINNRTDASNTRMARMTGGVTVFNQLTLQANSYLFMGSSTTGQTLFLQGNVVQGGTLAGTEPGGAQLLGTMQFQGLSGTQTVSGGGTYTNVPTLNVANMGTGVTLTNSNPLVVTRVNLFTSTLNIGTMFTIGRTAAAPVVQIGGFSNTIALAVGGFNTLPAFDNTFGVSSYLYANTSTALTTGAFNEMPAGPQSLSTFLISDVDGITVNRNITSLFLTMSAGNINIGANAQQLGTTAATPGTLTYTAGFIVPTTGSFTRFFNTTGLPTAATSGGAGHFPIGSSTGDNHSVFVFYNISTALTTGGSITVMHNNVGGLTGITPFVDGSVTVDTRTNANWPLSASGLVLGGGNSASLALRGDSLVFPNNVADIRLTRASDFVGTAGGAGTGSTVAPLANRAGLAVADLTNTFYIGSNMANLPPVITWDGGAATLNWGDAANWSTDSVPTGADNVSLSAGVATSISVNGNFAVNNLFLGANFIVNLGSNTLTVNGNYAQTAGTMNLNTGTLEPKGGFTFTAGTFNGNTGTTLFSGSAAQAIAGGVTHNNVIFRNGGAGIAKNLTAGNTFTAAGNFTVETTAQLALTAVTATTYSVAGNFIYGGVTGGANIASLTVSLTGAGKLVNGSALGPVSGGPTKTQSPDYSKVRVVTVGMLTDVGKYLREHPATLKGQVPLTNTFAQRRAGVDKLLAQQNPADKLVVNLDDMTVGRNPASFAPLSPPPSLFEMNVTVASTGSYTLQDNINMNTGRTLTLNGRLDCGTFQITGAGALSITSTGTLGTATVSAAGFGATVVNTGVNTYTDGTVEYNAAGAQTINTTNHPGALMIQTGGSGAKTLDGNKTITGNSGSALTRGAIFVNAGSTFADGGFVVDFTTTSFANVIVNGTYLSTGAGGITWQPGPFLSNVQAVDGTQFGDITMNFALSTSAIEMNSNGSVNVSFRNMVCGGTAGGTLRVNETGTTNVTINGNVSLAPTTATNTGGGFGGTAATTGTVTVKGNITSTSTAATQPFFNSTGTNTLVMGGASPQTLFTGANAAIFAGATLKINNAAGFTFGNGTGRTYTIDTGGTLEVMSGAVSMGATDTLAYNAVSGTLKYSNTAPYSQGAEWAATAGPVNATINGAAAVALNADRTVPGILRLTTGNVTTGVNTLTVGGAGSIIGGSATSYVIGNLKKTYNGAASFTFAVGTANGFSPVAVNVTAGTFPADFTVIAVQGPQPNLLSPTHALQRYWTLTATGLTADLTFTYLDPTDIPVTANENQFVILKYDGAFSMPGGSVNTVANTATITGVTVFSDWTLGEPGAPTDVALNSFTADGYSPTPDSPNGGVLLKWQTGYEVANLGFNIYRDQAGKRVQVTPDMVAGSALFVGARTVLGAGRSYVWRDTQGQSGDGEYWLEAVDINGSSAWHGPVRAVSPGVKKSPAAFEPNSKLMRDLGQDLSGPDAATPVETKPKQVRMSAERLAVQAVAAGQPAVKIAVRREGWYRITQSELAAAGVDPRGDPLVLQLMADGQEQPINVLTDKDGGLSAVEFYGIGAESPYTSLRTYWLAAGEQPGKRIEQVKSAGTAAPGGSFPYAVERRDRTIYFSALRNGDRENFFGAVIARGAVDQSLTVKRLDTGSSAAATLEVALQGVTIVAHSISVELNGSSVGVVSFNSQAGGVGRFNAPPSLLKEGQNVVRLTSQGGQGDVSLVDYIRLTYPHRFTADSDALRLTVAGKQQVTIDGFSSSAIRVLDVTNANSVQELVGTVQSQQSGYAVALNLQSSGQRTLLAIAGEMAMPVSLAANIASTWRQPANGADLLILTRRDFFAALDPLRSLRQKQGYSVALVDIEDVYDEFSYGQKTPQAVKDFCAYASANWKKAPRFVMLAGDASFDPKNYLGFGDGDLVPSRLVDTELMETASDDYFVDFNNDGLPDMAIGRLPVRSAEEALSLATKIAGYDGQRSSGTLLLVTDHNDTYDFESATNLLRGLIPPNIRIETVDRARVDDATAKAMLIDAINRGQLVVNYAGHGSVNQWRGNILTSEDAAGLTNSGQLSLFVMMTCLNGYFQDAALDSLGESLLKAEGGGAVAVWGSSGMTTPDIQSVLNQQAFRMIFNVTPMTKGEATARAKAAVTNVDVRRTWILLGDPTTRLAR